MANNPTGVIVNQNVTVQAGGKAYRAATMSIRAIAAKYDVSEGTVRGCAKKYKWGRAKGIKAMIRRKAERQSMVAADVKNIPDEVIADQFAGAEVLRSHQKNLGALRAGGGTHLRLAGTWWIDGHRHSDA